jgi:hypothetical protein
MITSNYVVFCSPDIIKGFDEYSCAIRYYSTVAGKVDVVEIYRVRTEYRSRHNIKAEFQIMERTRRSENNAPL